MKTSFLQVCTLLGFILLPFGTTLYCQPEGERFDENRMMGLSGFPTVRYDCINLPSTDSLKSRILVELEISESFFIFYKSNSPGEGYVAAGDGSVEIIDSARNPVTRRIFHVGLQSPVPPSDSGTGGPVVLETLSFDLAPGSYDISIDVSDSQSTRRFHRSIEKRVKDFRLPSTASDVLILTPGAANEGFLDQLPVVGDALFGKDFQLYFEVHSSGDTLRNLTYKFFKYEIHPTEKHLIVEDSIPAVVPSATQIGSTTERDTSFRFAVVPSSDGFRSIVLPVNSTRIEYGHYMLEVKYLDGRKKVVTGKLMEVRWPSMPRSLARIDYAVELLQYMMTPVEFDSLKSLDRENQVHAFEKFWKSKDPTPGTAYNEALEEYYHRADYARTAFASVKSPDGAFTDRGKITILFGIPPSKQREFPITGPPVETWTYPSLHKRFIFTDEDRNGSYRLISVDQL